MTASPNELRPHYEICPACNRYTLLTKYIQKPDPSNAANKVIWEDAFCIFCKYKQTQRCSDQKIVFRK